ncbi:MULTISPECIES: thioredoxin family protein [unclassified Leeuwenhoekiella]|uniref:thioredoxin family protein n=1 Tax=unclassified Leeuwenhoekiella TaxID=2615029 RepID=UPI000C47D82D|nr:MULTISPECIES: thioredoxin family protein [unclassified Leeuwenhoekiella]MAW95918.1 thiol-disulfide isomerase [Leeuwenhoekiella sp.]MBA79913.1 thiol-disulfide isomerase [Leeuwenhoekiella sp.]|tara:strand:+ start:19291 stop:19731 length:441 start_codon:yes stop_codon:yes gene_type:complete
MKKILLSICFIFLAFSLSQAQEWQNDFGKAKSLAAKQDKPIILVFQGSDWCAPCIKLNKEIWETEAFQSYAKDHYVMLQADFPRKAKNALPAAQQEANNKLAETYNKNGYFPLVVVLDKNGKVLGNAGYEKTTPAAYIKKIDAFLN